MATQYFDRNFCLEIWGDYACFTRPEMKVERVSYDVITPSAARAIFEAIFWKPAIKWQIRKIEVLNHIKWISVRRNEVGVVMSDRSDGLFIEDAHVRHQRAGLFLRDVKYRISADLIFIHPAKRAKTPNPVPEYLIDTEERIFEDECKETIRTGKDDNPGKYNAIFERRARKGQCFNRPYLGCREFSCMFRLVDDPKNEKGPIKETRDLGFMLYDMDFTNVNDPKPAFFKAMLEDGVVVGERHVLPAWDSEEVLR